MDSPVPTKRIQVRNSVVDPGLLLLPSSAQTALHAPIPVLDAADVLLHEVGPHLGPRELLETR